MLPLRKWSMPHSTQENKPQMRKRVRDLSTGRRKRRRRGQGERWEDGEGRGAAEKNTTEFSLNLSAEKSFLTVTQNQPQEKKA